ncbi:hexose kinase [candidate division KSB1 bacterium]|nr:hexose kinase [candidate division KSB1 bacterium]
MKILTLTMNPTVDVSSSVENVAANQKLRCNTPRYDPGGGGINVSRAIKKLGGSSVAFYPSGEPTGSVLEMMLSDQEIDQRPISIKNSTRENLAVLETSSDQQYRFVMPGPEMEEIEWQECLNSAISADPKPDFIVASGSLPPGVPKDFYGRLAEQAQKQKIKLVVDTKGQALKEALQKGLYFIKPNFREFQQLAGREIKDEKEREQAAKEMIETYHLEFLVISLGAAGGLFTSRDECKRIHAPVVDIRSKVGAGDSMVAGIVLKLVQGESLLKAVEYGVAAGSAAVMTPGSELCHKKDVEKLYNELQ